MNLKTMIGKGYFPKELPPPFQSNQFANRSSLIKRRIISLENSVTGNAKKALKSKNRVTKYVQYRYFKGRYSRRPLSILHPVSFLFLADEIVSQQNFVKRRIKDSTISVSIPTEYKDGKRAYTPLSRNLQYFRDELVKVSHKFKYQLQLDIVQFYPSIYTHSIAWTLFGYDDYKELFTINDLNPGEVQRRINAGNQRAIEFKKM